MTQEYFLESEMLDDVLAPAPDPHAPKPEGPVMTPVAGEPLIVRSTLPLFAAPLLIDFMHLIS